MRHATRALAGAACAAAVLSGGLFAQTAQPDLSRVTERLDRLEEQNRQLLAEIRQLRSELAAFRDRRESAAEPEAGPPVGERLQVQEARTAELAQSKVEASHRFPIRLTGMALFNAYLNSSGSGGGQYPTVAQPGGEASGGATLRQSIVGFDFDGPRTIYGGKVRGSLRLDLFGGSGQALDQLVRLRTATLAIDWENRSISAGIDKPIISQREPESLAQVGVSPLSGAGNLWLWIPQVRFEQDFHFSEQSGVRLQTGVVQTHEVSGSSLSPYAVPSQAQSYVEPARPGGEARLEFFRGTERRIEVAGGIHRSVSQVMGTRVPSDVYSIDWFAHPWRAVEFTGTAFTGRNVTPLGTGALRQGYVLLARGRARAVDSRGGWAQLTLRPAPRVWLNFFSGQQDDRNSDLPAGAVGKNLAFGANLFYRLAPNVLASFEASQTRTARIASGIVLNNHYDFGLAYLF